MRNFSAALATLGLTAMALTGCAVTDSSASCTRPQSTDPSSMGAITVTGAANSKPHVRVLTPFRTADVRPQIVESGSGTPITDGDQSVLLDLTIISGETGKELFATQYNGDPSQVTSLSGWTSSIPALSGALECAQAGSRVSLALPGSELRTEIASQLGLGKDESVILVVDVQKVYRPRAAGDLVYNTAQGLPSVVRAADGRPGISVPGTNPPEKRVLQTLIRGDGAAIQPGDVPRVNYTVLDWDDPAKLQTTWDAEPRPLTIENAGTELIDALVGQTVGSQVLVVLPTAQTADQPGPTLVSVIDILGIDEPPA